MSFSLLYDKALRLARAILELMVTLLFAIMVILVFSQVWVRFLTDSALTWSEELARFVMAWLVYTACVLAYADNAHIIVDALVRALKGKVKIATQLASQICVLAFVIIAILGAIERMPSATFTIAPASNIVMAHVFIIIPVSMIFLGLIALRQIWQSIMALKNPAIEEKATP